MEGNGMIAYSDDGGAGCTTVEVADIESLGTRCREGYRVAGEHSTYMSVLLRLRGQGFDG